jgi:hypothetical protein
MRIEDLKFGIDISKPSWYIYIQKRRDYCDLSKEECLIAAIKVLEIAPKRFYDAIFSKFSDDSRRITQSFPVNQLIIFCVNNKMDYWLKLGIRWLSYIEIDDNLRFHLNSITHSKAYPQDIRHSLIRILNNK